MFERRWCGFTASLLIVAPLALGAVGKGDSLPDPTRPSSASTETGTVSPVRRFRLDSVLVGNQRRRAVINGAVLATGDQISGATLVRIGVDHVLIEVDGQHYTLELDSAPSIRRQ